MVKIDENMKALIIEAVKKGKTIQNISENFSGKVNTVKTIINQ